MRACVSWRVRVEARSSKLEMESRYSEEQKVKVATPHPRGMYDMYECVRARIVSVFVFVFVFVFIAEENVSCGI